MKRLVMLVPVAVVTLLLQGCATTLSKPDSAPQPATVRLGTFANVALEPVEISPEFAAHSANKKAAKKINELLQDQMVYIFPNMNSDEKKDGSTLVIKPLIKEIKFIGGAARFWLGAMAGSSAVLMQVDYIDKQTADVVAAPEFYNQASAMGGAYSMGTTDNLMLDQIVDQIIKYTKANR